MRSKKDILEIKKRILQNFAEERSELKFKDTYQLLVCVMLSAQCTDKRVNLITPRFFAEFPSVAELAKANLASVKLLISSCNFYNNKAVNLIKMAQAVVRDFDGVVPLDEAGLKSLAGVGQKTAHVVLLEGAGANVMAVDTHVFRVANRLRLAVGTTPLEVEKGLQKAIPRADWSDAHHWLILHGRQICKARKPLCGDCPLSFICPSSAA